MVGAMMAIELPICLLWTLRRSGDRGKSLDFLAQSGNGLSADGRIRCADVPPISCGFTVQ